MITQIKYKEYHELYGAHLMADVDILPKFRILEVEFYDRDIKWFRTEHLNFNLMELMILNKPIRSVLIS